MLNPLQTPNLTYTKSGRVLQEFERMRRVSDCEELSGGYLEEIVWIN